MNTHVVHLVGERRDVEPELGVGEEKFAHERGDVFRKAIRTTRVVRVASVRTGGVAEHGQGEVHPAEAGAPRTLQIRVDQNGVLEASFTAETGDDRIGQVGTRQVCARQVGFKEQRLAEVRLREIGS